MKMWLPGWRWIKIEDGQMKYKGKTYPLKGAEATILVSGRDTPLGGKGHAVVIDGPTFQVRLPLLTLYRSASKIASAVNNQARQFRDPIDM